MATHSSVLAWRIPGTGEPGGLPSMGSHRVGHDWSDLAAAAALVSTSIKCLLYESPIFVKTLWDTVLKYVINWKKKKKKIVIVCSPAYVTRFSGFNFPAVALTGMTVCLTWPGVRTMSMCLSPVVATAPYSSGIPPGPQGHCRSSRSTLRR